MKLCSLQYGLLIGGLCSLYGTQTFGHEPEIERITIEGKRINLVGDAVSASEGVVGQKELELRPLLRTGEVLELVPGMVVTQHSGSGKANQFFLRGFNLDHGTDFATFVDGMPVNMRSHGHGQGYTDINFIIPETISIVNYKKGAYYADVGDFSGAGSVAINTATQLEKGLAKLTLGEDGYQRLLAMNSFNGDMSSTLLAVEGQKYDGPWTDIDEDISKTNVLLKHTRQLASGELTLAFMAYDNSWNSADQIPQRAVSQGLIDEFGSIDDSVGGESSRYSLSADWQSGAWQASAYVIDYDLNLWSNFTYFLDDESLGDQFEQVDDRLIYGGKLTYTLEQDIAGYPAENRFGTEFRIDDIDEVGLYHTQQRQRLGVTRSDEVEQTSLSAFWENKIYWNHHISTVFGVRYDYLDFDVKDRAGINRFGVDLSNNSGDGDDDIWSFKGSLIYTINNEWETYLSAGQGFHSNDARGVTIKQDPVDGAAVDSVDPLVQSTGYEIGVRGFLSEQLNTSISIWTLELDSELLFVGDAGNTETSRPSTRKGVELVVYYYLNQNLSLDFEYAYADAEFDDTAPEGDEIPGAIENVLQAGLNADYDNGWFGSLRLRYFGERPLIEDGSVKSDSTTLWNLRVGYQQQDWTVIVDLLNLTDSNDHDIDYFYESRLTGEPPSMGTEDIHYHVVEPRSVRVSVEYAF